MANKTYSGAAGVEAGVPNTKLRAEQMKSEDGFTSLAVDLEALRGQVKDIIGGVGTTYKEDVSGFKVQLSELAVHVDAETSADYLKVLNGLDVAEGVTGSMGMKLAGDLDVNSTADFQGAVQFQSTINVDGEATLASATVEDISATHIVFAGVGGALSGSASLVWDGSDLVVGSAKVSDLVNQQVVFAGASGALTGAAGLTYDGSDLVAPSMKVSDLTATRVVYAGSDGALVDSSEMTFGAGGLTLAKDLSARSGSFSGDVVISGDLQVMGATTTVDTQNLLVKDAKIVISSGGIVDGAGIYLADDTSGENIRWATADGGKWVASDKFAADTMQALDLSSAIVWADASGNLVEISDTDLGSAVNGRLAEGTGVDFVLAAGVTTISIGQDVYTTSSVTFASVTGSNLTAARLMASNANKGMVSADLFAWVAGTTNQVSVADDADGSITLSLPQDIHSGASPEFAQLRLDGSAIYLDTAAGDLVLHATGSGNTIKFEYADDKSIELGSAALVGFTATDIMGALNELKSVAGASSKKATYEHSGAALSSGADIKSSLSADFISELNADNGLVFVNGQMMLSGALGSKDYTVDGGVLKFTFGIQNGDVVVVQKA